MNLPFGPKSCEGMDPDIFFPVAERDEDRAKLICQTCPSVSECLEWAIENREPDGIWGGMNWRERNNLRRARQRAVRLRNNEMA